jgi:hypothetical protein
MKLVSFLPYSFNGTMVRRYGGMTVYRCRGSKVQRYKVLMLYMCYFLKT